MKYVCLVYLEQEKLRTVPDRECHDCGSRLRARGALLAAEALQPVDLAEALQTASKIPPAREGSIEVRPVRELTP